MQQHRLQVQVSHRLNLSPFFLFNLLSVLRLLSLTFLSALFLCCLFLACNRRSWLLWVRVAEWRGFPFSEDALFSFLEKLATWFVLRPYWRTAQSLALGSTFHFLFILSSLWCSFSISLLTYILNPPHRRFLGQLTWK